MIGVNSRRLINRLLILRREYSHLAFYKLRKILRGSEENDIDTILIHPVVTNQRDLDDILNRLGWYFPPGLRDGVRVFIQLGNNLTLERLSTPQYQSEYDIRHLPVSTASDENSVFDSADVILVWDKRNRIDIKTFRRLPKVELIDPTYYSQIEPFTWLNVSNETIEPIPNRSKEVYEKLEDESSGITQSIVFANGPSLQKANKVEFDNNTLKIICNSLVQNPELLSHIDPDILAFFDPAFHFGPSDYAQSFRDDAITAIIEHELTTFIPSFLYDLFVGRYPDAQEYIVGLESIPCPEPLFPTSNNLQVMRANNILTGEMLPVASALTNEVYIMGADGREKTESYFWDHYDGAQYDDNLMESVFRTHPSFFRDEIYTKYYQAHLETLRDFIEYGETQGINYHSLTESNIKSLNERRIDWQRTDILEPT